MIAARRCEAALLALLVCGCSVSLGSWSSADPVRQPAGSFHVVRGGENLFRIALYYYETQSVDETLQCVSRIREANNLSGDLLRVGQRLFIPGTRKRQPSYALVPPKAPPPAKTAGTTPPATGTAGTETGTVIQPLPILKEGDFSWPLPGQVICGYGELGNAGVDILAQPGAPVVASRDGTVSFVGTTAKYGETIILEHPGGYFTVYGHDLNPVVKRGAVIRRGQTVAEMKGGSQKLRYLHFEIRTAKGAVDPLTLLPSGAR